MHMLLRWMCKNMFNPGIEPGTVCVLGRRDNHYTNWKFYEKATEILVKVSEILGKKIYIL